jgi:hypothetical protein
MARVKAVLILGFSRPHAIARAPMSEAQHNPRSRFESMNLTIANHRLAGIARPLPTLIFLGWLAIIPASAKAAVPTLVTNGSRLILANGYVYLEFDQTHPSIDVIKSDFYGHGSYSRNLVTVSKGGESGIVLETVDADGSLHRASAAGSHITYQILQNDTSALVVSIQGLQDRTDDPVVTGAWTLSLSPNSRNFTLTTRTVISRSRPIKAVQISAYLNQWFMNGLFQRGVVQYVRNGSAIFFTTNALHAFYTMDNQNGSIGIIPKQPVPYAGWAMESYGDGGGVGLKTIVSGHYPIEEKWTQTDWKSASDLNPATGATFENRLDIFPNQFAFPSFSIPIDDPMSYANLSTFYTAIYGSAAGVLGSFEYDGSAYPTLATPNRTYGDMYTFFDPDSWSTVATLSFSGDPYLQDQARRIVELAGTHMRDGQIPHHFIAGKPTYIAISKAIQTGPNIFWVMAAIDYASGSGDEDWLRGHYPQLKAATDWILNSYDPKRQLVNVGGPLFIDVFIRQGYTLDSNAMLLHLLPIMASAAKFCGDAASESRYSNLANEIKRGINDGLWNGSDHYITQRSSDWVRRDMVDYDGNYAAIAFGAVTNRQQISAMYHRLDGGPLTHPGNRGTWVSEKYYGPADCYGGNTGDSATAMGRIWWLDLESRYVTGDLAGFNKYFAPVQNDLLRHTWLTERYDSKGQLIRAPYYHEYPEVVSIIQREMIYGIDVKINRIRIKPFGLQQYHYKIGTLDVFYSQNEVSLHIPGHGIRTYEICGLLPRATYILSGGQKTTTQSDGCAVFRAPVGQTISLHLDPTSSF